VILPVLKLAAADQPVLVVAATATVGILAVLLSNLVSPMAKNEALAVFGTGTATVQPEAGAAAAATGAKAVDAVAEVVLISAKVAAVVLEQAPSGSLVLPPPDRRGRPGLYYSDHVEDPHRTA